MLNATASLISLILLFAAAPAHALDVFERCDGQVMIDEEFCRTHEISLEVQKTITFAPQSRYTTFVKRGRVRKFMSLEFQTLWSHAPEQLPLTAGTALTVERPFYSYDDARQEVTLRLFFDPRESAGVETLTVNYQSGSATTVRWLEARLNAHLLCKKIE